MHRFDFNTELLFVDVSGKNVFFGLEILFKKFTMKLCLCCMSCSSMNRAENATV